MKTFLQWVEEHKLDLPVFTDADEDNKKPAMQEKAIRNIGPQYPDAYKKGQYMDGKTGSYFAPANADVLFKLAAKGSPGGPNTAAN
jgi:hypothetical protein